MKHHVFYLLFLFTFQLSVAQKSKVNPKAISKNAIADNITIQVIDNMVVASIATKPKITTVVLSDQKIVNAAQEISIQSFTADKTKLYLVKWSEISTNKTDLKLEEITTIFSKIITSELNAIVFSNYQKETHITEKVFLDKLKNASETQVKIRREGFELILNADGSIIQKNKTQENKWAYKSTESKFVDSKKK